MLLPTSLTNRRQFLERSMLGFGSAFLLPSLLTSCTDHQITPTDPITPIIHPPLSDTDFDWDGAAKTAVTTALGLVPDAGGILSALVDIFWPSSKVDVWSQVKAQVEALVKKEIDTLVYQQVQDNLTGLNNSAILYLDSIQAGDLSSIKEQWIITRNLFVNALPHFQSIGYEVLLLPMFAQFANMYLSFLRDAIVYGKSWGMNDIEVSQIGTTLTNAIADFTTYVTGSYGPYIRRLNLSTQRNDHLCEPFRTTNNVDRQMTLMVLSYMDIWQYYDISKYPSTKEQPTKLVLPREIYSDPFGTCDDSGLINLPTWPTQPPTTIQLWAGSLFQAVQVTYPSNSGPNGVTQTPIRGAQSGNNYVVTIPSDKPIIQARATYGSVVNSIQLMYLDGTQTDNFGSQGSNDSGLMGYNYQIVSSIWINGMSAFYHSADCVVFGYQYWVAPATKMMALGNLYVKSPKERSVADFAKAFPELGISASFITEELKLARAAYWAYIKTRAKALK